MITGCYCTQGTTDNYFTAVIKDTKKMDSVMAAVFAGRIVQIYWISIARRSRRVILFFMFLNQICHINGPYHIATKQEEYNDIDKKLLHIISLYNMIDNDAKSLNHSKRADMLGKDYIL
ncbi:MAG TPA: hypothetical protein ENI67_06570 [Gammaproteobacteria bacterium]|nr:hypothetical protein [Gammaproteobacteria bacterium]